jgi:hypothetical protein
MADNINIDLRALTPTPTLGDIRNLAAAVSEASAFDTRDNITASTTQTQAGGTRIFRVVSRITTANANDAVTLAFKAKAGDAFTIINDSGQTIRLFPASGDKLNDAATDALVDIADNTMSEYFCPVDGLWFGGATAFET